MRASLALIPQLIGYGVAFTPNLVAMRSSSLCMSMRDDSSRAEFISRAFASSLAIAMPSLARAFDGGVGGLGKTRPITGVVFRDADAVTASSSGDDKTNELLAPDGSPAFVTFQAPWPLLKSAAGIEARDIAGGFESSYVQVAELPKGITNMDQVKPAFLSQEIFGSSGKFGMYGAPTDIKIKRISPSNSEMVIYLATFTTLTPAMRESDRKAYISASIVGNGLFMLITSTTSVRFNKLEDTLKKVAESFAAIPAPKSSLRKVS